jgi:hypothetical protein
MTKNNFTFLIFILTLLSCGQNRQQSPNNISTQDSATSADFTQQEQKRLQRDSIEKAEQDKAIGDIGFYISEKQFNKEKEAFIKKCKLPKYEFYKNATIIDNKIGGYGFNSVDGWFYKDSLYSIELRGCLIDYDEYNIVMPDQYNALMELLKSKYGQPKTDNGFPSWTSIEKGYFRRCAAWEIGDKTIEARISCDGTQYTLNLAVFKPAIGDVVTKEADEKLKEETKKGSSVL